jgi:hypothetical protein
MLTKSITSLSVKILILTCGLLVFAQVNRFLGQWVGDLFLVESMMIRTALYLIDEHNILKKEIPSLTDVTEFPIPHEVRACKSSSGWHEALHTMTFPRGANLKDANSNLFRSFTFAKWGDDEWHYLGSYNTSHTRMLSQAIPCDNDKFIFISHETDIDREGGEKRYLASNAGRVSKNGAGTAKAGRG